MHILMHGPDFANFYFELVPRLSKTNYVYCIAKNKFIFNIYSYILILFSVQLYMPNFVQYIFEHIRCAFDL